MAAAVASHSRNPLRSLGSPYPRSPHILANVKQEMPSDGTTGTPRVRASSDPPPVSDPKLLRTNSTFDLEPNPFEQSFGGSPNPSSSLRSTARDPSAETRDKAAPGRRARSQSPSGLRTPGGSALNGSKLPPLSSIASPQVTGSVMHHFGWSNIDHSSLRSGPLSPAMLHGPTPGSVGFSNYANLFDPSSFRTGLTPSVTGGTSAHPHSIQPPSPATQALFAMMTNGTPNANGTTSTAHPGAIANDSSQVPNAFRSERDMPNHFELGFRNMLEGKSVTGAPHEMPITTAMNMPPIFSNQMPHNSVLPAHKPQMSIPTTMPYLAPGAVHPSAMNAFNGQAGPNPLYLLTQAQQELSTGNNNEDDHIAAGVLSALNAVPFQGMTRPTSTNKNGISPPSGAHHASSFSQSHQTNGSAGHSSASPDPIPASMASPQLTSSGRKRRAVAPTVIEEEVPIPPPAQRGRRKGTGKKQKLMDEDEDAMQRPETEEEKRKNFLERNRQAALKCRQRKKAWLANLQAKVEYLTADNETLQTTVQALREEIASLRTVLIAHKDCPVNVNSNVNGNPSTVGDFLAATQRSLPERPQPPVQAQFQDIDMDD